jgi:hypothetical protein
VPRFFTYLGSVVRWLFSPRLAWLAAAATAALLYLAFRAGATNLHMRLAGMVFQWLGVGTVAYGVRQTRKMFRQPSLSSHLGKWLSQFPRWHRDLILGPGGVQVGVQVGSARLDVWMDVTESDAPDRKVQALLHNVQRLRERTANLQSDLDKVRHQQTEAMASEERTRRDSDADLEAQLRKAQTGGLHITFVGLIWLFLGVLLTSVPQELQNLLH